MRGHSATFIGSLMASLRHRDGTGRKRSPREGKVGPAEAIEVYLNNLMFFS